MAEIRYPKPQKGNPHDLTVNQHVFPRCSLARFADPSDDRVAVRRPPGDSKELRVKPNAAFFCAMRVWDHGAESGYMKAIEDKFQAVAEQVTSIRQSLADDQHIIVTNFFALWAARAHLKANPIADSPIHGISGKQAKHTLDDQEILEKNNIGYTNEDLSIPGRGLASGVISISIMTYQKRHRGQRWGVVHSPTSEFIVPDQFGAAAIVPITPRLCLVADCGDIQASEQQVRDQNRFALAVAREYIVAQSFADCPL
jgi:hypothetical protein